MAHGSNAHGPYAISHQPLAIDTHREQVLDDTSTRHQTHDVRFDDDDVAGIDGTAIAHALDAGEERNALAVLGFCEHEDRTDLRDGFGQNRRRQDGPAPRRPQQVAFVPRYVFYPDDPL